MHFLAFFGEFFTAVRTRVCKYFGWSEKTAEKFDLRLRKRRFYQAKKIFLSVTLPKKKRLFGKFGNSNVFHDILFQGSIYNCLPSSVPF